MLVTRKHAPGAYLATLTLLAGACGSAPEEQQATTPVSDAVVWLPGTLVAERDALATLVAEEVVTGDPAVYQVVEREIPAAWKKAAYHERRERMAFPVLNPLRGNECAHERCTWWDCLRDLILFLDDGDDVASASALLQVPALTHQFEVVRRETGEVAWSVSLRVGHRPDPRGRRMAEVDRHFDGCTTMVTLLIGPADADGPLPIRAQAEGYASTEAMSEEAAAEGLAEIEALPEPPARPPIRWEG